MKKITAFAAASVFALCATTALAQDADATQTQEANAATVVATVNGTDITLGHMIITMAQLPDQYKQLPANVLWDGILEQLVQQELLANELTEVPARAQSAIENEIRSIKAGEAIAAMSDTAASDEAIQAAYDEQIAGMEAATEYNASHILVATEEEALAVKERVEGGEDFAEVAKEASTGPSGPNGGLLGWFGEGMMVAPFEEAVMGMETGAISDPVQTQFGWHVIKLNETRDQALPTLEEMRTDIAASLQEAAIAAHLAALEEAADVTRIEAGTIDPALLSNLDLLEQ